MAGKKGRPVDWGSILAGLTRGRTVIDRGANRNIFRQGQLAESLFYLRLGKVKLTVISKEGKEAIVAILVEGQSLHEQIPQAWLHRLQRHPGIDGPQRPPQRRPAP